ncbi:hypothetical protein AHF37_00434 [Paragonimus kellicotti]|nr:hypothetical protein AHF37_00434 [Paragonimus kellicotti]
MECWAKVDESIADAFLNERELTETQAEGWPYVELFCLVSLFQFLLGSALRNRGVQPVLDAIMNYSPNQADVEYYALDESTF